MLNLRTDSRGPRMQRTTDRSAERHRAAQQALGWPLRESRQFGLFPDGADHFQFSLNGSQGAIQPSGDLLVGQTIQLCERDGTLVLVEHAEQSLVLLGELRGKLRRGFVANEFVNRRLVAV